MSVSQQEGQPGGNRPALGADGEALAGVRLLNGEWTEHSRALGRQKPLGPSRVHSRASPSSATSSQISWPSGFQGSCPALSQHLASPWPDWRPLCLLPPPGRGPEESSPGLEVGAVSGREGGPDLFSVLPLLSHLQELERSLRTRTPVILSHDSSRVCSPPLSPMMLS